MQNNILLLGAGGHCKVIIDTLKRLNTYSEIGIIDRTLSNNTVLGIPIVGTDEDLETLYDQGWENAFIAMGNINDFFKRSKLFDFLKNIGFKIPSIIDPSALVSIGSQISEGTYIGKNAIINPDTYIKKGVIVNSGAIIEHDTTIGSFTHIAPGAVVNGAVEVLGMTHIGSNATILQNISIGSNSIIGAGSVVTRNVSNKTICYGVPAKEVKTNETINNR